jgi:ketosteroid isomerase-like protein
MNYSDLDRQLNEMIIQGKSVEAFDRFYAEDVVAQENDEPERVGLEQWKQARAGMEKMTKKFDAKVLAHAANGDVTFSEWEYNLDFEGMGPIAMKQIAVRRWKDGRIVRERFYHK